MSSQKKFIFAWTMSLLCPKNLTRTGDKSFRNNSSGGSRISPRRGHQLSRGASTYDFCRVMKTKGMVFRYTWVYSKEDTMAHTRRLVVTS